MSSTDNAPADASADAPADAPKAPLFADLGLPKSLMKALDDVGYESPSPIQARTIPLLLQGRDLVGQAQTGTGKTAAFALPLLARINAAIKAPQVLVLTPTRELAIQVAEAFKRYASHMKGFTVLPVYGGQDYRTQLRPLQRGVQVVVGTPGRVMDHIRRGTLQLEGLEALVLDEADEMLRMGFIDDVEWILQQTPDDRQIALFSATMPSAVRRIAKNHLTNPAEVTIEVKTATADTINQRYWVVHGLHKLDALTRLLETEEFDAMLVFVRTKTATGQLAEKLEARGYAAAPLNGDIAQRQRERTVERLKSGRLEILVATDVAARGLDVDRISHVINFDIPYDTEAYVHRIGRTGRAGRKGEAILFVAPREKRMLRTIENAIGRPIDRMGIPTTDEVNVHRVQRFKQRIAETEAKEDLAFYRALVADYCRENDAEPEAVAAALAHLVQGDQPLLLPPTDAKKMSRKEAKRVADAFDDHGDDDSGGPRKPRLDRPDSGLERYRIEVGHQHGVQPGNIVGAIANEAGLDSSMIGRIDIQQEFSFVDLPVGMPKEILRTLKQVWICRRALRIARVGASGEPLHTAKTSHGPGAGRRGRFRKPGFGKSNFGKGKSGKKGGKKPGRR